MEHASVLFVTPPAGPARVKSATSPRGCAVALALLAIAGIHVETAYAACAVDDSAGPGHLQVCRSSGPTLSVRLEAKPATVAIGPYQVVTETLNGRYVPPILALQLGTRLDIDLRNNLPPLPLPLSGPNIVNLHTHGLIVSPRNARTTDASAGDVPTMDMTAPDHGGGGRAPDPSLVHGRGDNVYVSVLPGHSFDYRIDLPRDISASGQVISRHPEGLFWYHPHIHGLAQRQVSAGMASAILIGSPKNSLRVTDGPGHVVVDPGLVGRIDEQVLILKDIELAVDKLPNEIDKEGRAPVSASWIGKAGPDFPVGAEAGFVPTACTSDLRGASWCVPGIGTGRKKVAWLFTVNGQLRPDVIIKRGRYALLRILNTSPTVTYALRLAKAPPPSSDPTTTAPDTSDANTGGRFAVISVDGTTPGEVSPPPTFALRREPAPPPAVPVETHGGLLLLPASRAEVLVVPDANVSNLVLQTVGFRAGAQTPSDAGAPEVADLWPSMDLATLTLGGDNTPPVGLMVQPEITIPTGATPPLEGGRLPGCTQVSLRPNQRRQILLDSDGLANVFMIGSRIVTTDTEGQDKVEGDSVITPQSMPMMGPGSWSSTKHVCVRQGSVETWEIVNLTNEIHNFHIHQSKFRLAPGPMGSSDPNKMLEKIPLFSGGVLTDLTAWHDTFPIPPAKQYLEPDPAKPGRHIWVTDRSQPGSVRLIISFAADQQVGRFVFHCHILEHEDKGMMAPIEVLAAAR